MASRPTGAGIDGMFIATLILLAIAVIPLAQLRAQEHQLSMPEPDGRSERAPA